MKQRVTFSGASGGSLCTEVSIHYTDLQVGGQAGLAAGTWGACSGASGGVGAQVRRGQLGPAATPASLFFMRQLDVGPLSIVSRHWDPVKAFISHLLPTRWASAHQEHKKPRSLWNRQAASGETWHSERRRPHREARSAPGFVLGHPSP